MLRCCLPLCGATVLAGCATPPPAPTYPFVDTYVGTSGPATLTLEALRELPASPAAGWLNNAEDGAGVGRFGAKKRGHPKFELTPVFVTFDAERRTERLVARYQWRDGALVVCMLSATMGTLRGSDRFALTFDYATCATLQRRGS